MADTSNDYEMGHPMSKILCIEDEADLREDIVEELELAGHIVLQAADGREGLEMILKYEPDIVISDITMPRMNGNALLKEIRNNYPKFAVMPFIFLSALADKGDVVDGLSLGADDYLTKPIDFELLITKVNAELRRVRRIRTQAEQDYLKLYKALSSEFAASERDKDKSAAKRRRPVLTASLVGMSSKEMWTIQELLAKNGHDVKIFNSGNHYVKDGLNPPAHVVFLWHFTNDIPACEIAPHIPGSRCLRILVCSMDNAGGNHPDIEVDCRLKLPISERDFMKKIYDLGAKKFVRQKQVERVKV